MEIDIQIKLWDQDAPKCEREQKIWSDEPRHLVGRLAPDRSETLWRALDPQRLPRVFRNAPKASAMQANARSLSPSFLFSQAPSQLHRSQCRSRAGVRSRRIQDLGRFDHHCHLRRRGLHAPSLVCPPSSADASRSSREMFLVIAKLCRLGRSMRRDRIGCRQNQLASGADDVAIVRCR